MVAHTDPFEPRTRDDYPPAIQPVFKTAPAQLRKTHPELWTPQVDVTTLENDLGYGVGLTVDDLDLDPADYFDSVTDVSETSGERLLAKEELFMLLRPATDPLAALFPPKPLTVQELRSWLDTAYPHPYDEYTAFVRNEPDTVDGTLVASYRDCRDASVIRFQIQHGRQLMVDFIKNARRIPRGLTPRRKPTLSRVSTFKYADPVVFCSEWQPQVLPVTGCQSTSPQVGVADP